MDSHQWVLTCLCYYGVSDGGGGEDKFQREEEHGIVSHTTYIYGISQITLYLTLNLLCYRTGTWTVAGQHLGVGMLNPVYYSYHTRQAAEAMDENSFSIPVSQAAAILPSILLGAIYPCYLLITRANSLDTDTYQQFLAALQPFGLFVSAFQLLFSTIIDHLSTGISSKSRNAELPYLRVLYGLTIAFATLLHNYTRFWHTVPDTGATAFSWNSLYLPSFASVTQLSDVVLVFMRNDILVLGWGAVLWAWWLLRAEGKMGTVPVTFLGLLSYGLLGPGATCVGGMWIREEMSRNEHASKCAKNGKRL